MNQIAMKQAAAKAALQYLEYDSIIGVGTGSTTNCFIEYLPKNKIKGAVASSRRTAQLLRERGIEIFDLNEVESLTCYVDGADEINDQLQMIKGGGAALTSEKIVASVAKKFICIADQTKKVKMLGKFPVPIEVIPMARSAVARALVKMGGSPVYREGCVTDHNNVILDVWNLEILEPKKFEQEINNIPGVVTCGIFALRPADILLLGTNTEVQIIK